MKKLILICALLLAVPVALAAISSVSGDCTDAGSADSLNLTTGVTESNDDLSIYSEQQGLTLGAALAVDIIPGTLPATYDAPGDLGGGSISNGTKVDSYIAHCDRNGITPLLGFAGSVEFDTPILGVIVTRTNLLASDGVLGGTGTTYDAVSLVRALELNGQDEITLNDAYTVSFDIATAEGIDEVRIIVSSPVAEIEKTVDPVGTVELGDHLTVTLVVDNPYDDPVTVVDEIPEGLAYIPGTFYVDTDLQLDPSVVDNVLTTTVATGNYTLEFELQVVEVGYEDSDPLTNIAKVYAPDVIPDVDNEDDSDESDEIILSPYDGFSKEVVDAQIDLESLPEADWYYVPWHTDVHWFIEITVEDVADEVVSMENIVVTDNLGGDLELDAVNTVAAPAPPISKKKKENGVFVDVVWVSWSGETKKVHLSWDVGDDGDLTAVLTLEVSTDWNPGQKKKDPGVHGYTSTGLHDLNSGATLKFTDGDTLLQLSAHTGPITVEAFQS